MDPKRCDSSTFHRPDFREMKVLYAIFFDVQSIIASICVPKKRTITGQFYAEECIKEVEEHYSVRRPSRGAKGIRLMHDNVRPHKPKVVSDMITSIGMIELPHPPYSRDLIAPNDFWLFSYVKKQLAGKVFDTRLALGFELHKVLKVSNILCNILLHITSK